MRRTNGAVTDDALAKLEREARETVNRIRGQLAGDGDAHWQPTGCVEALGDLCRGLRVELAGPVLDDECRAARVCEILAELTELQGELREFVIGRRFRSLARIHEGLARLRELPTVDGLVSKAPGVLCECCDFDRAVLSRIRGPAWVPQAICISEGQDAEVTEGTRQYLSSAEIPLGPMLLETELARRGAPGLVSDPANDARTFKDLMTVTQTQSYVAAPIMSTGRAIGFLHADTFGSGRTLSLADRDNLWTFVEGFSPILERVILLERLAEQRRRVQSSFKKAEEFISEFRDADVKLVRLERESSALATHTASMFAPSESRLHSLLTARELEILELMVSGARNKQIADKLVISEATVKSHVKNVCRKLRASTRSEAVSRYLRLAIRERM